MRPSTFWARTLLLAGSPLVAQSAWTKAPALPTACYGEQDAFGAALDSASCATAASTATVRGTG